MDLGTHFTKSLQNDTIALNSNIQAQLFGEA